MRYVRFEWDGTAGDRLGGAHADHLAALELTEE
jgi:hypothetical protein